MDDFEQISSYIDAGKFQKELDESKQFRETIFGLIYVGVPGKHSPTKCAAKLLFPDRFFRPFSRAHDQLFEILDSDEQYYVILAPRGWGKTSLVNLAYPARKILTHETKFFVPIGNNATNAILQSDNLKQELLSNTIISKVFGPIRSDNFSKEQWVTDSGTMVMARGRGQAIRGLIHGDDRPDDIVGDDMEDPEEVRNELRRSDTMDWWLSDVRNSVDRPSKKWRVGAIGTLLHEDSLLANMSADKNCTSVRLSLCTESYKSNWTDFASDDDIKELVNSFKVHGKLDMFYREYMNIPAATEDASFKQSYFQEYQESSQEFQDEIPEIENIVIGDPAKTAKMQSADSALITVGINLRRRKLYVRDVIKGKMYPDEFVNTMIDMGLRARIGGGFCMILAPEVVSLDEWIVKPLKDALSGRGVVFQILELKAQGAKGRIEAKDARIGAMSAYYRTGWFYHNPTCCAPLEQQLLSFPRSKMRDLMDALSNILYIMECGKMMFDTDENELKQLNKEQEDEFEDSTMWDDEDVRQLQEIGKIDWEVT